MCHKVIPSSTSCPNGHFICDDCRIELLSKTMIETCNEMDSTNPIDIMYRLMEEPSVLVHGAEYHVIVGSSLIVAYCNAIHDKSNMDEMLHEMTRRGRSVPAGFCANSGSCGAGISAGTFYSIVTRTNAFSTKSYGLSNKLTSNCLGKIGDLGGPRCCRRSAMASIEESVEFIKTEMGVTLELPEKIICKFPHLNTECTGNKCPYHM